MGSSLDRIINSRFRDLGEIDLRILQHIAADPTSIQNESAQELAHACNVSAASVTRMAQKLGFSGYSDLKYYISRELPHYGGDEVGDARAQDFVAALRDDVAHTIKLFEGTAGKEELFRKMDGARHFYAFGTGYGQRLMIEDYIRCMQSVGRSVELVSATGELKIAKQYMNSEDLVLIASFSGDTSSYRDALSYINVLSTPVVSITNLENNELASFTDFNLYYQMSGVMDDANMSSSSYVPLHVTLHLLFEGYREWKCLRGNDIPA